MADIKKWLPIMEKWEGGCGEHPNDSGGFTCKGVTIGVWSQYAPIFGKPATKDGLRNMTRQEFEYIVRKGFWEPIQGDRIQSDAVAAAMADFIYNSGIYHIRTIQQVLNQFGANLMVDGVFGQQSLAAVNRIDPSRLFDAINERRRQHYQQLVAQNPSKYGVFLTGWLNRLNDLIQKKKTFSFPQA